jgi:hypothetical protein
MKNHKYQIVNKAYICTADIDEKEYLIGEGIIVMGKTAGEAKKNALSEMSDYEMWGSGEYVTYTDIRVRRRPSCDIVLFEGEELKVYDVDYEIRKRYRDNFLNDLLKNHPNKGAYIYCGCRGGYWGPNHNGYYSNKNDAGIYSIEEAVRIVKSNDLDRNESIEIVNVDSEIELLKKKMVELQTFK